jgi:serine/threonine protein kinase
MSHSAGHQPAAPAVHSTGDGNNNNSRARIPKAHQDWCIPECYEIRQLIGTGSYGHVCEAYDNVNNNKSLSSLIFSGKPSYCCY